jgi:uncharacterized protein (AIM24 family)
MQSPLFAHNDQQTQERWSLQNKQMLRVALEGHDDILARKGTMVAYQGLVEFDAEYQSNDQSRARAHTGEGLDLMRCHGQGTVYLANLAQRVHVMEVEQDGLTVDTTRSSPSTACTASPAPGSTSSTSPAAARSP